MKRISAPPSPVRAQMATATVDRIDRDGVVWLRFDDGPPFVARVANAGLEVPPRGEVVVLVEADRRRPPVIVSAIVERLVFEPDPPKTLELSARERLTLRVGDASIEILADGSIEIYGARVESYATGIQRIKGAQVRIN